MFKLNLENSENQRSNCQHPLDYQKKQESSIKISTSASMTLPKLLIMWVTKKCGKFFKRWELEHLTCLLRNLYAGHEATVRTRHRTSEGFKIGKEVGQSRIWSPCLFNLYAEYIMRNTGLDEAQHEIKLGKNISNLRYADETTFMAENKE